MDRTIVLYVGRMVPGKGLDELAAALDGLRDTSIMRAHVEAFCTLEINTARLIEDYRRVLENARGRTTP